MCVFFFFFFGGGGGGAGRGVGFGVSDLGFRVWGLRFRV